MLKFYKAFIYFALFLLITSCGKEVAQEGVLTWQASDPKSMNPINTSDANARRIAEMVFQPLVHIDYFSYELVPVLAKARPKITKISDSLSKMEFEIRPEAVWDNGEPITGKDVAFTLKIIKTPKVDCQHLRGYFEHIYDLKVDEKAPKKFTMYCSNYMLQESSLTDLLIYPAYVYDPDDILSNYTVAQLHQGGTAIEKDVALTDFAESFNSPIFQRDIVSGSNAYTLEKFETNQQLVLKRKTDWWGADIQDVNTWYQAYPTAITYKTIPDRNTAVVALKKENIEAMYRIDPLQFTKDLKQDTTFTTRYNMHTPIQFLYSYIGMNMENPKLSDAKTRQALTHLMDVKTYGDKVFYGMWDKVNTFIHPSKSKFVNKKVPFTEFNPDKARTLLKKAGWSDADGDGILEKEIEGQKVKLSLDLVFPNVAKTSEKGILIFKEDAAKVGVEINPVPLDFGVMLDKTKKHDFEMYFGIWSSSPLESDPHQIWHTDSQKGGSNYISFGDQTTDKLIEDLRKEIREDERAVLYKKLQTAIYEQAPYIFIMATQNRVAIHKKFIEAKASGVDPGYWLPGMKMMEVVAQ